MFRWFILRFDVPTPGRAGDEPSLSEGPLGVDAEAAALVKALGGASNLLEIDACTTRLRLRIVSQESIDESSLKALGAAGILRPTKDTLQVVMGLRADEIADNMRAAVGRSGREKTVTGQCSPGQMAATTIPASVGADLLAALGGAANVIEVEAVAERLTLRVKEKSVVDENLVLELGFRGIADLGQGRLQLLAGGDASELAAVMSRLS